MDLWRATHKQISDTAKFIYGYEAKNISVSTGLWAFVTLTNGKTQNVYDYQIDLMLQAQNKK